MRMKLFTVKAKHVLSGEVLQQFIVRAITQKEAQTEAKSLLNARYPNDRYTTTVKAL